MSTLPRTATTLLARLQVRADNHNTMRHLVKQQRAFQLATGMFALATLGAGPSPVVVLPLAGLALAGAACVSNWRAQGKALDDGNAYLPDVRMRSKWARAPPVDKVAEMLKSAGEDADLAEAKLVEHMCDNGLVDDE